MPQNFKNFIFIFSILLLFANMTPIRAEEKAVPEGLSTAEWLECVDQVVNEFNPPIKACLEKNRYRSGMCDTIIAQQNEASDKEIKKRCVADPKEKTPSSSTEQTAQYHSTNNNQTEIPNYTWALVVESPKENDFRIFSKTDFKKVNPESTTSATPKPATDSANLTGTTFVGKVGSEGELILQLPNGKEIKLTEDKSAFEGERPYTRWRDIIEQSYAASKKNVYIEEIDCHILLEQERRDQETIKRLGGITYASDWGVDDTIIVRPTGNCSYTNEGGPVRVSAVQGQVIFKTLGGTTVSADNADFGIGYNAKSAISIFEVYNGSITVKSQTGNSKIISAVYGSEIKQIKVDKDGVMSEKIAIPQSQWEAFLANKQEKKDGTKENTLPIIPAVAVLGLGGAIFFLYQTGKLTPLYQIVSQKITVVLQKIRKEKKID